MDLQKLNGQFLPKRILRSACYLNFPIFYPQKHAYETLFPLLPNEFSTAMGTE